MEIYSPSGDKLQKTIIIFDNFKEARDLCRALEKAQLHLKKNTRAYKAAEKVTSTMEIW